MLIREEKISSEEMAQKLRCLPCTQPVFLDIETTGLGWRSSHIYLIGILFNSSKGWILRQYFLERPFREKELLEAFSSLSDLPGDAVLVSYNGDTFDLPYLRAKYAFYDLPAPPFLGFPSLDLLREVRPLRSFLGLCSLKQSEISRFLGIAREDPYSGGDLIEVYREYLGNGSRDLLDMLFLHNHEDVRALPDILSVLAFRRFKEGGFAVTSCHAEEHPESTGSCRYHIGLSVSYLFPVPARIEKPLFSISCEGNSASLLVSAYRGTLRYFFPGYQDYYYLPDEDEAIHRSVARYMAPSHRVKATAATCYQRAEGLFLPVFGRSEAPVFYESYRSSPAWFRPDPAWADDPERVRAYCMTILDSLH